MLSSNSILQQGRYRIIGQFSSSGNQALYDAYDNLLGNKVVLHETVIKLTKVITTTERGAYAAAFTELVKKLKDIRHDGIVRVKDGFSEIDRQYLVTEPVESKPIQNDFINASSVAIGRLLDAVEFIGQIDKKTSFEGITSSHIRRTSDGNNRMLYFGSMLNVSDATDPIAAPFKALESIWNSLDLASQKAISNEYDEKSLEILESQPDIRTAIYAVGATVYQIVTGTTPADALERSIEILDGKPDPLIAPDSINSTIQQPLSDFLLKAMQLRREHRFQSATEAYVALSDLRSATSVVVDPSSARELDNLDLLEIPAERFSSVSHSVPAHAVQTASVLPIADIRFTDEPVFHSNENIVENTPLRQAETSSNVNTDNDEVFEFLNVRSPAKSNAMRFASVAAVSVIVIAGAIWGFVSFASNGEEADASAAGKSSAVMSEPAVSFQPIATPEAVITVPTEPAIVTPEASPSANAPSPVLPKERPVIGEAKPLKRTETQPGQKPTLKPKKAVTVDDLISDN